MNTSTIDQLNTFLRDELAAVETYGEALQEQGSFAGRSEVSLCYHSHEVRVAMLRAKIVSLGGEPAEASGLQGSWSKPLEHGAAAVGPELAVRALEEGENHVLSDYRRGLPSVDPDVRAFLERMVLPEEEYTHRTLTGLKDRLSS